jgi:hypothetical protein
MNFDQYYPPVSDVKPFHGKLLELSKRNKFQARVQNPKYYQVYLFLRRQTRYSVPSL